LEKGSNVRAGKEPEVGLDSISGGFDMKETQLGSPTSGIKVRREATPSRAGPNDYAAAF
jgi:hypothetical protein